MKLFLIILLAAVTSACTVKTPHSELNGVITQMVTLIDEGRAEELLSNHVDLSSLPETNVKTNEMSVSKLKILRYFLLRAKELTPEFTETNTVAIYKDPASKKPMKFKNVDGRWLLLN